MVDKNLAFGGFLRCRIAMVEDQSAKPWLVTLNMDNTLGNSKLPEKLILMGKQVLNNIYTF